MFCRNVDRWVFKFRFLRHRHVPLHNQLSLYLLFLSYKSLVPDNLHREVNSNKTNCLIWRRKVLHPSQMHTHILSHPKKVVLILPISSIAHKRGWAIVFLWVKDGFSPLVFPPETKLDHPAEPIRRSKADSLIFCSDEADQSERWEEGKRPTTAFVAFTLDQGQAHLVLLTFFWSVRWLLPRLDIDQASDNVSNASTGGG